MTKIPYNDKLMQPLKQTIPIGRYEHIKNSGPFEVSFDIKSYE